METATAFGLFLARGPVLHDAASGLALDPRRVPLAYLLPAAEGEGALLCLATAAGEITATIRPRAAACGGFHDLVAIHHPAPVDAAAIRARLHAAALVRAA
ncbi:hypothetical protein llg_27120 [Luteolibacter sp. LG18]|nr:hypothetical protein llg_27120 [Luteolibacter sp. LG18]